MASINEQTKIIGGLPALQSETRHQVSLRLSIYDDVVFGAGFRCGGSLITYNAVLTAGHCVFANETS